MVVRLDSLSGNLVRRMLPMLAACFSLCPAISQAQVQAPDRAYVYVSYFVCDPTGEARADEIIERNFKPHYDAAVEGGNLVSWSWLSHYVGGDWRRAHVITATNMDDLLDSSGALGEIIEETTPEAGRAFTEVCRTHVDYVWETIPGVGSDIVGGERGDAGFSMYFECNIAREERADELVREVFLPMYNAQVEQGGLVSWAWLKHNVGGKYRRLLTMTGSDHKSLARTRAAILESMAGRRTERSLREFNEICFSHEDYLWDIQLETP